MLRAILNKSWRQHPTRHQLYGHLPPITKTIKVRRARHAGNCWKSKDELISDVLLWTPAYGQAKAGRPAWTYIHQLCEDTGCSPEDQPKAMNDREGWQERVRCIRVSGTTWWWWGWFTVPKAPIIIGIIITFMFHCFFQFSCTSTSQGIEKLLDMKLTIIPIMIGAFGTVNKLLLKGLEDLEVGGRVATIQTTALLRMGRILRIVLETWGN